MIFKEKKTVQFRSHCLIRNSMDRIKGSFFHSQFPTRFFTTFPLLQWQMEQKNMYISVIFK